MKMLKTLLLDVYNDNVNEICIEDELESFYDVLKCDCIEIVNIDIGGRRFDVMCDEEGLLKSRPIVSAVNQNENILLVGNLLFFNSSTNGDLTSLSDSDISFISKHIQIVLDGNLRRMRHCLTGIRW